MLANGKAEQRAALEIGYVPQGRGRGTPVPLSETNPNALGEMHEAIHKISQDMGVTVLAGRTKIQSCRPFLYHE